jgi:hypothetical protein
MRQSLNHFNARRPNPSHWTQDFVEHLRTVHLALATVSVSLLVVLVGAKDIDFSKALTQATEVSELSTKWGCVLLQKSMKMLIPRKVGNRNADHYRNAFRPPNIYLSVSFRQACVVEDTLA